MPSPLPLDALLPGQPAADILTILSLSPVRFTHLGREPPWVGDLSHPHLYRGEGSGPIYIYMGVVPLSEIGDRASGPIDIYSLSIYGGCPELTRVNRPYIDRSIHIHIERGRSRVRVYRGEGGVAPGRNRIYI